MRDLIRPTLFLVARLGLFLALVAWIVGQKQATIMESPVLGGLVESHGVAVAIVYGPGPKRWRLSLLSPEEAVSTGWHFEYPSRLSSLGLANGFSFFSVTVHWANNFTSIAMRHWLVITIFALFNGGLMWAYRKRGKELAADE